MVGKPLPEICVSIFGSLAPRKETAIPVKNVRISSISHGNIDEVVKHRATDRMAPEKARSSYPIFYIRVRLTFMNTPCLPELESRPFL